MVSQSASHPQHRGTEWKGEEKRKGKGVIKLLFHATCSKIILSGRKIMGVIFVTAQ